MRRRNSGSDGTAVLLILIVLIFSVTIYFCLDIFQIIDIPEEYSIARLFNTRNEELLVIDAVERIIPSTEENKDENTIVVILDPKTEDEESTSAPAIYDQESQYRKEVNYTDNRFYYNQLDDFGKTIYDKLYKNKNQLKTGKYTANFDTTFDELLHEVNGGEVLNNSFQLAVNALTFDNPDIFYLDITKIYLLTEITTTIFRKTYRVSVGCNEGVSYLSRQFPTESSVNVAIANSEQVRALIEDKAKYDDTEDKIRAVHDYMIDIIDYDTSLEQPNIYNTYGALVSRLAVCEGYAKAFKYVMDDMNIPCIIVCGTARDKEGKIQNHAWNYVQINNQWYAVDVTWDDPIIIGNGTVRKEVNYIYYLKGSDNFFEDHTEDGNIVADSNFKYPKLSVRDY